MEKYLVAESYKNYEQVGEPFENEKGKMVIKIKTKCDRCGGGGLIVARVENGKKIPIPVDGGICYKCNGTGIDTKIVRVYSEKEYAQALKAKERSKARKMEAEAAIKQDLIDNAEKYKHEAAIKFGFGDDEKVYIVYGGDTFSIKDQLKEAGARFNPTFKWYFSQLIEDCVPEGYKLLPISFDEVCEYSINTKWVSFKKDAAAYIATKIASLMDSVVTVFYPGQEKERIYDIAATLTSIRGFEGYYGYTYIYTFKTVENYNFIWMTSKKINFETGSNVILTGTIKKFEEYNGMNNTYLTRCVISAVEE